MPTAQGDDDVPHTSAEESGDGHQKKHHGEGHESVHDSHDGGAGPTVVAGQESEQHADGRGDENDHDADHQGDPGAVHDAA